MRTPTRRELKAHALLSLSRGRYGAALASALAPPLARLAFLAALAGAVRLLARALPWLLPAAVPWASASWLEALAPGLAAPLGLAAAALSVVASAAALAAAFSILVAQPLDAGRAAWFLAARGDAAPPPPDPFRAFRGGRYARHLRIAARRTAAMLPSFVPAAIIAVLAAVITASRFTTTIPHPVPIGDVPPESLAGVLQPFLTVVPAFLAALVPAGIRAYELRPVAWVAAERDDLPPADVLSEAERLARGRRTDLVLLDLSLAGWIAASLLVCGLGLPFVAPYMEAVRAEGHARLLAERAAQAAPSPRPAEDGRGRG